MEINRSRPTCKLTITLYTCKVTIWQFLIIIIIIIIIITDLYSAFRSEDTEALDAAQQD